MAFGGSYVEGWKYVNLRRHFIYEKRSIDGGAQWAVFEPKSAMPPGRASILARE
jgi:phage tail sheath protein FI